MPIRVCTCNCGSTDQLARSFLHDAGYKDFLSIQIPRGKEASRQMLQTMPPYPEVEMLDNYLREASKWVVIIGWNENGCRWSDIAHNATKSRIDAKLIVETFS